MLSEWHLSPDEVNNKWTDELLAVMLKARAERLNLLSKPEQITTPSKTNIVSDVELFKKMNIKVEKR